MKFSNLFVVLIVVSNLLLAGCTYPQDNEISVNFYGSLNATESGFQMEGDLHSEGGIPDQEVFHEVTVTLYSKDKTTLHSVEIGELKARQGKRHISLSTSEIPYYITFNSPDFWAETIKVEYYVRQNQDYSRREATAENELPQ